MKFLCGYISKTEYDAIVESICKKKKNTQYYFMCKKFSMIFLETWGLEFSWGI